MFSGYIAFLQKPRQGSKPILKITSASGQMISESVWKDAEPVKIGWSTTEELAVVQKSGYCTILNLAGKFLRRFSFGKDAESAQIKEAKFFVSDNRTGLACLTGSSHIFITTSLERPRILFINELPCPVRQPLQWEIVIPEDSILNSTESPKGPTVLAVVSKYFYRLGVETVSKVDSTPLYLIGSFACVLKMSISPRDKHLAVYVDSGLLWVGKMDFSHTHFQMNLKEHISSLAAFVGEGSCHVLHPTQIKWMQEETILLLQWDNFLVLVDLQQSVHEFFYPSFFCTDLEVDGIRVITQSSYEIIQRVPTVVESLGRIGASCPALWLLSAYKNWEGGLGRAHDFLLPINSSDQMYEAVVQCLNAAGHSALTPITNQKTLLNAARFGRGFLSLMLAKLGDRQKVDSERLREVSKLAVETCKTLCLLNNLAAPWISIALTWHQYSLIGPSVLLDRLLSRGHYPIAMQLVKMSQEQEWVMFREELKKLRLSGLTRILSYWISQLPASNDNVGERASDVPRLINIINNLITSENLRGNQLTPQATSVNDRLHTNVSSTVDSIPGLSFTDLANKAIDCGHKTLAVKLLEYEPRASHEIPVLLKLNMFGPALTKAVESGDSDLLLTVLLALQSQSKLNPSSLSILLRQHPTAMAFYREHLQRETMIGKSSNAHSVQLTVKTLSAMEQEDDPTVSIKKDIISAFTSQIFNTRVSALEKAKESYHHAKRDFLSQQCEEAAKLLNFHRKLEAQRLTAPVFKKLEWESMEGTKKRSPITRIGGAGRNLILPIRDSTASEASWQNCSVSQTYLRLIASQHEKLTDQMRREFRIPDKRVAHLRLIGLAFAKDGGWLEIEKLALSRKPAVSLEALAKVYIDSGHHRGASAVIARLPPEPRIRYLIICGNVDEAIGVATKEQSEYLLYYIQRLISKTDKQTYDKISAIRAQLK